MVSPDILYYFPRSLENQGQNYQKCEQAQAKPFNDSPDNTASFLFSLLFGHYSGPCFLPPMAKFCLAYTLDAFGIIIHAIK